MPFPSRSYPDLNPPLDLDGLSKLDSPGPGRKGTGVGAGWLPHLQQFVISIGRHINRFARGSADCGKVCIHAQRVYAVEGITKHTPYI